MNAVAISQLLIDPVIFRLGPLELRWYGLMYLIGFVIGAFITRSELKRRGGPIPVRAWPELVFYAMLAIVIGGRLGHILIFDLRHYLDTPSEIFATWHGGMSFHGGLLGIVVAAIIYSRCRKAPFLELTDLACLASPIGIMLAKIGNFINGELYGRITTVPWGVVFPEAGELPRHPSQLYEAVFEGPVLFALLWRFRLRAKKSGEVSTLCLIGYGGFRFLIEFFREPDPPFGLILGWLTMGQILCLGMVVAGTALFVFRRWQE